MLINVIERIFQDHVYLRGHLLSIFFDVLHFLHYLLQFDLDDLLFLGKGCVFGSGIRTCICMSLFYAENTLI